MRGTVLRGRFGFWTLIAPACLVVALGVVLPLITVLTGVVKPPIGIAQPISELLQQFVTGSGLGVLIKTVWISLLVAAISALVGFPIAYFLYSRPSARVMRGIILVGIFAPLIVSVTVRSFAWVLVLVPNTGALAFLTGSHAPSILFTDKAIIVGLVQVMLPFMVLAIYGRMTAVDNRALRAARTLGAGTFRIFVQMLIPMSAPGVINGFSIVYVLSSTAVAVPLVLGGGGASMMGALIYQQYILQSNYAFGGILTIFLIVSTVVVTLILQYLGRLSSYVPL